MSFRRYYEHYLTLHQNRNCRRLHLLGMAVSVVIAVIACWLGCWWMLPLALAAAYPFAWLGHFAFEHNHPAAWQNPLRATAADLVMTWQIFRGRLKF
jgi:hypothetical protein